MNKLPLYGVFAGTKFGLTRNRANAIERAKEVNGTVRVKWTESEVGWDAPTFMSCSIQIWPITEIESKCLPKAIC